jgi:hypothetical protein
VVVAVTVVLLASVELETMSCRNGESTFGVKQYPLYFTITIVTE